ncbi:hypothetical protein ACJMK2_001314, partial [Sinanodonta woodiana]
IPPNPRNIILQQLKDQRPLISKEKYDDLVSLCQKKNNPFSSSPILPFTTLCMKYYYYNGHYCHH